jgi:hypothetical protein
MIPHDRKVQKEQTLKVLQRSKKHFSETARNYDEEFRTAFTVLNVCLQSGR